MGESESVKGYRAGFVSLVGRPNVGKSTLMNAMLGVRLSIATPKPQTTRNRILGVRTVEDRGQLVFLDTPGIHRIRRGRRLNRAMVDEAVRAIRETEVCAFVVEAKSLVQRPGQPLWGEDADIAEQIAAAGVTCILVVNKVDQLRGRAQLLPALAALGEDSRFIAIVPVSALKGDNVGHLEGVLLDQLPEAGPLFPEDTLTDRAERFFAAEMIREQVLLQTDREVPYSVAVEVELFSENPRDGALEIQALIHVERESQKGIVIGRGGQRLKAIGTAARARLEAFFGQHVRLELLVRVQADWADRPQDLSRFGYEEAP
ncbi:MAG: GTPase Era [Deltaproteobacteria bacterium]|nr:MAG: GTPase Era [Deltaproteobacteria bacterium]